MDRDDWEFIGYAVSASGVRITALFAHRAYAGCSAIVAADHRGDHEEWCRDVIRR